MSILRRILAMSFVAALTTATASAPAQTDTLNEVETPCLLFPPGVYPIVDGEEIVGFLIVYLDRKTEIYMKKPGYVL